MCGNTCLRSLLFSRPQHTTRTQLSFSQQLSYCVFVCHLQHQVWKWTFQSDLRYYWQGKRAVLASVQPSDCRCRLVPTFLLASAETPARPAASAGLSLHCHSPEWTAHQKKSFGLTGPIKLNKSTVMVVRDNSGEVKGSWLGICLLVGRLMFKWGNTI